MVYSKEVGQSHLQPNHITFPYYLIFKLQQSPKLPNSDFSRCGHYMKSARINVVTNSWNSRISGCPMFVLTKKLMILKQNLKDWNHGVLILAMFMFW